MTKNENKNKNKIKNKLNNIKQIYAITRNNLI